MALDPSEFSVKELRDVLGDVDDDDELEAILEAEQDGKDRKTAVSAIEGRINAVEDAASDLIEDAIEEVELDAEDIVGELAEEAEEEPEPAEYPAPDSDDGVYFDPGGAGRGAVTGHDTIHLLDEQRRPRCEARVGNRGGVYRRSALAEGIDECSECPTA